METRRAVLRHVTGALALGMASASPQALVAVAPSIISNAHDCLPRIETLRYGRGTPSPASLG